MTHTIETTPDVDRALEAKAARRGVPVDVLLRGLVSDFARTPDVPASEAIAALYADSIATGGELTALSSGQEDIHQYSADELAAMEGGLFENPGKVSA